MAKENKNGLGFWPSYLAWFCALLSFCFQSACTEEPAPLPTRNILPCKASTSSLSPGDPPAKSLVPGAIEASFSVTSTGEATYTMPLVSVPGRNGIEPKLALVYNSAQGNGILGAGFSLAGLSSITRCPQNLAQDAEIRDTRFDEKDPLCLDGRRLVQVGEAPGRLEFRTFPDSFVKVLGHYPKDAPTKSPNNALYFEAYEPSGLIIEYGRGDGGRPIAKGGVPRVFLQTKAHDGRGNAMHFLYCFAEADGYTAEYALNEIRYTSFEGEPALEASRSLRFVYGKKDPADIRVHYTRGMAIQKDSLRLDEIQMLGAGNTLVRRYLLGYTQSPTTKRTLLTQVEECAADGACKPPTRFQYAAGAPGFKHIATNLAAPTSKLSSPMLFDINGDGLDDLILPDTNPALSTPQHPITEWRVAKNLGPSASPPYFSSPKIAFSQTWPTVQNPSGPADPSLIQPELGTVMDYNQDGRADIWLHDVYGSRAKEFLLITQADLSFEAQNSGLRRPFPLGAPPPPPSLTSPVASVHLADLDGDGVADRIQCEDHGDSANDLPSLPVWKAHLWRPSPGFEPEGQRIEALAGFPCGMELFVSDLNADGKADLMLPSMLSMDGVPSIPGSTYSALSRLSDGSFEVWDSKLKLVAPGGRLSLADVNGDALPDALMSGFSDHALRTYINTGLGFEATPINSLKWDGIGAQDLFFHLAAPLDYNSDGLQDLLMPMPAELAPNPSATLPAWVILEATGALNGPTFKMVDAKIPFEPLLGDAITLADPRGPRIGDLNGDGAPDVLLLLGAKFSIFENLAADQDLLVAVSDGMSAHEPGEPEFVPNLEISYGHLIDASITQDLSPSDPGAEDFLYLAHADAANECNYPRHCAVGARRVVSAYRQNDGLGGRRSFAFAYRDGRFHRLGQGSLGFGRRLIRDLDTGALTVESYDNASSFKLGDREVFPFAGQVKQRWQAFPALPNEPNPNQIEFLLVDTTPVFVPSNDNAKNYSTRVQKRRERQGQGLFVLGQSLEALLKETEASGVFVRDTSLTVSEFDAFGNAKIIDAQTTGADLSLHIERTYSNDIDRWIIGILKDQKECSTGAKHTQCRILTRTLTDYGEVENETRDSEPADANTRLFIEYERDTFGNITKTWAEDAFGNKRELSIDYDAEGIFPISETNALGHTKKLDFDARFGLPHEEIDPNGFITSWNYDSLGRLELETRPDGTQTQVILSRSKYKEAWRITKRTVISGGEDQSIEFDSLGRPVRLLWHGPDTLDEPGTPPRLMQVIEYDSLNAKVARRSLPAHENTPEAQLLFDAYEYDALGREIKHTKPWKASSQTSYKGLEIESIDALGHITRTQNDSLGRPISIIDAELGLTNYEYGPFSTLYSIQDPGGAITKMHRDAYGRVWKLEDPDRGTLLQAHNGFGDLLSSSDALGRSILFVYDALGRKETRIDQQGAETQTTQWIFDSAEHGIGRLHKLISPDGQKTYAYNAQGKLEGLSLALQGENDLLVSALGYDAFGRVSSIRYPSPNGTPPFVVTQDYDPHGYLLALRDQSTKDLHWKLSETDNAGRIQKEIFGNGSTTERKYFADKERIQNIFSQGGGSVLQDLSFDYDQNANLSMRRDALQPQFTTERFRYDALSRLKCAYFSVNENPAAPCALAYGYAPNGNLSFKSDVGALSYTNAAHPHALTNAGGESFGYDAVGNQVARPGGVALAYTPFDLPKSITDGPDSVTFGYDGDHKRIRKTTPLEETLYFGDLYERVTQMGTAATEHRYYVHSPERVVAIVTRGGSDAGTRYVHVDHLGSVDALSDEAGKLIERRSYDPFGQRRNAIWGQANPPSFAKAGTSKGFTGHEGDFELGLINMKGRIYDPRLGRFLTTDPLVANAWEGQSFNGYSYVLNNPLNLVDPSGFVPWDGVVSQPGYPDIVLPDDLIMPSASFVAGREVAQEMEAKPAGSAADVGASAPAVDVGTTGSTPEVIAPDYASLPVIPVGLPGGPGAPVGLPGGPGLGPLNAPGPFKPGAFGPGTFIEPPPPGGGVPAEAPGLPTGPAKAPGVTVGGVLGGALFILSMGTMFAGDAPNYGFDEDGIPLNKLGMRYPRVIDERTGKLIPFPEGELMKIPADQRTKWNKDGRKAYIREWQARGYPRPPGNWVGRPEIHHIKPLLRGGTNDFWNLVPLEPEVHDLFTEYWNHY